ncbi:DUF4160 domain-containing protein [Nitrosomonas sp.]|uniref:DUF4160 domain-containing protein n=1 Tax=Nitrosomonas sp. TaxID=42353 RepID=UPI0025FCECF2|nr:DUF4160 domain-containing protein [Nitrosomonas sp.]
MKPPTVGLHFIQPNLQIITIEDGTILNGSLPPAKMKLVQAWIEIHRDELMADWKLAVSGEPLFKIEPLR